MTMMMMLLMMALGRWGPRVRLKLAGVAAAARTSCIVASMAIDVAPFSFPLSSR